MNFFRGTVVVRYRPGHYCRYCMVLARAFNRDDIGKFDGPRVFSCLEGRTQELATCQ